MEPISKTAWGAFIGGVIVIAVFIYIGTHSKTQSPAQNGNGVATSQEWASNKIDEVRVEKNTDRYIVSAAYPVAANSAVTEYFKNFVESQVNVFVSENEAIEIPPDSVVQTYSLNITYENERSALADNYLFLIAIDMGGAHGLQAVKTFSFTQGGSLIETRDLFANEPAGLAAVATYVQKELEKNEFTNDAWILDGAGPREENYDTFVVTDTGVRFIFDPYQVAAYAAGIVEVEVPVKEFRTEANPNIFK